MKNKGLLIFIIIFFIIIGSYLLYHSGIFNNSISFSLAFNKLDIQIGDKYKIGYTINKDKLNIEWKSDNSEIVKVDSNGNAFGVGLGSTFISATVNSGSEKITRKCYVSTFYGDKSITLKDIIIEDGELFITKGDKYHLPVKFSPSNSYVNSIKYQSSDESIVVFDGDIKGINVGSAKAIITVNNTFVKDININVLEKSINPIIAKKIDSILVDKELLLNAGESKKINYSTTPQDAFIYDVKWESSDDNIVSVDGSIIKALKPGKAKVLLTVNNIINEISIVVKKPISSIKLISESTIKLKVGDFTNIKVSVLPIDTTGEISYTSSNSNLINITKDGKVTALNSGSGFITVMSDDETCKLTIPFTVYPKSGILDGNGNIWGYTSNDVVTPSIADNNFFMDLARSGKGTISNGIYTLSTNEGIYTYNISKNLLEFNNRKIYATIFYPKGKDLSMVNTFTFFGGIGESYAGGYYTYIKNDPSKIKSSGIIILISHAGKHYGIDGVYATNFVKNITNQKSTCKNTVGGFSYGGAASSDAYELGEYDKLLIFSSSISDNGEKKKLPNAKIIFYLPNLDGAYDDTVRALTIAKNNNYKNVTIISNNSKLNQQFSDSFLIYNPGKNMGSGHSMDNVVKSNIFAYACS